MSLHLRAGLVTLATPNFAAIVEFYHQLFQQDPIVLRPNVYAEFQLPGLRLGIFRPKTATTGDLAPVSHSRGLSLCLEVANLEAAIEHLIQLGYPPIGKIRVASHGREMDAIDPDGNALILHQGLLPTP